MFFCCAAVLFYVAFIFCFFVSLPLRYPSPLPILTIFYINLSNYITNLHSINPLLHHTYQYPSNNFPCTILCTTNPHIARSYPYYPNSREQRPDRVRRQPRHLVPVRWSRGLGASRHSGASGGAPRRSLSPDHIIAMTKVYVRGLWMDIHRLVNKNADTLIGRNIFQKIVSL